MEQVVLIDSADRIIGFEEKVKAHREGKLHRAISVIICDRDSNLLIHRRDQAKYHSGGLWTGPCCGHPRPGENYESAANRKLEQEMGFVCPLVPVFLGMYKAWLEDDDLWEHEHGQVFLGIVNRHRVTISPDRDEVSEYRWASPSEILRELIAHPNAYTKWFRWMYGRIVEELLVTPSERNSFQFLPSKNTTGASENVRANYG